MMARSPLRNVNDMVLALLLLLAGVGPGVGPGGAAGQLAAKPTRGPHPSSPCPSVFSYEGREPEKNRWYGVILVTTDEALDGLRLNVRLTHRAQILGNFIGDVSTMDNVEFTILSLKERLSPGPPLPVRIFAAFGDRDDIPYIANIKLNGRTICGNNNPVLGLDTLSRPQSTQSSRVQKPPLSRPAGVGGAGGGAGGAGSAGSAQQFDEEVRPRPTPPPTTPRPTPPPTRETATPQATTRSTPAYDPAPNANPDNYYSPSSMGSPNDSPSFSSSNRRNPEQFDAKRPAAARPVDDAYQPQPNYTSTTEGERGVYRPTTERHQKPTTERPAPVYTTKYAPSTERDAYPTTRTTLPPRPPAPSRPVPSSADRRPAPMDVDMSPQPWPTSNYDEPPALHVRHGGAARHAAHHQRGDVHPRQVALARGALQAARPRLEVPVWRLPRQPHRRRHRGALRDDDRGQARRPRIAARLPGQARPEDDLRGRRAGQTRVLHPRAPRVQLHQLPQRHRRAHPVQPRHHHVGRAPGLPLGQGEDGPVQRRGQIRHGGRLADGPRPARVRQGGWLGHRDGRPAHGGAAPGPHARGVARHLRLQLPVLLRRLHQQPDLLRGLLAGPASRRDERVQRRQRRRHVLQEGRGRPRRRGRVDAARTGQPLGAHQAGPLRPQPLRRVHGRGQVRRLAGELPHSLNGLSERALSFEGCGRSSDL